MAIMKIPTKKLKSGFELPVYGLGLWQMGGRLESVTDKDGVEIDAINLAIDNGITHIDTAEMYGRGHAEELLGTALQGRDRSKLIIASKVSGNHQSYDGVHRALEASLKRIGTDYLDLYILHRFPNPGIDIKDTMSALDDLVRQGVIRHIGVSNFTPHRLDVAQSLTANKIVCNQVHYNVKYREVEDKGILVQCQEQDVMLVAYRPLQKGILPDTSLLQELAETYGKTPTQIAINWLISQQNVVTISKTSNPKHFTENLGAIGWEISKEDIERIRTEYPDLAMVSDAVPLDYEADIPA